PAPAAGLAERGRLLAVGAVPKHDHVALALGQVLDRRAQAHGAIAAGDQLLGLRLLAGHQVTQRRLAVLADRLVERDDRTRRLADLCDLLRREIGDLGDLLVGGLALQLGVQLAMDAADLALSLRDVDGQPNRAGRVLQPARDGLPGPPRRRG